MPHEQGEMDVDGGQPASRSRGAVVVGSDGEVVVVVFLIPSPRDVPSIAIA